MTDPDIDPALAQQVQDAIDAVNEVLRESKQRTTERQALARQLFSFAAQGHALCLRWEIVQARRENRLFRGADA